jgi:hypothetical protein
MPYTLKETGRARINTAIESITKPKDGKTPQTDYNLFEGVTKCDNGYGFYLA